jgi:hypothetical protein
MAEREDLNRNQIDSIVDAIREAFARLVEFLPSEFAVMPLNRWTESVVRYFFCRFLAEEFPDIEQFVECSKIDLVLRRLPATSFIEFKFYHHPRAFDPYDGTPGHYKGGAGTKNLAEFRSCVEKLSRRRFTPNLTKFIVLVYADPNDGSRPHHRRYANDYDDYRHPNANAGLCLLNSSRLIQASERTVRAQLYQILPSRVLDGPTDSS